MATPAKKANRFANMSDAEKKVARQKDKSDRFVKLATKRTNKALKALVAVAALSNRNSYVFDSAQTGKIVAALEAAVAAAKKGFESTSTAAAAGFSL